MNGAITVGRLNKSFGGFRAVDDVSFEASEGKITALLGPSGSGKSTVLRMIAGLERPDSGRIEIAGEGLTFRSLQERRVGFVFQHYALFRHMTVRRNVAFGLEMRKESRASCRQASRRAPRAGSPLGIRLSLSRSAVGRAAPASRAGARPRPAPKVLLLDEPFGVLDARVRQVLRRWLNELHRELGVTSLLVTHDQEEALELANRVVVMHEGRVEQIGTPDEIYNEPATPFIAGFVGAANVVRGLVINGRVQFGEDFVLGAEHLSDGSAAHAYVRPHDVRVSANRPSSRSCVATLERRSNSDGSPSCTSSFRTASASSRRCKTRRSTGCAVVRASTSISRKRRSSPPRARTWPTPTSWRRSDVDCRVGRRGRMATDSTHSTLRGRCAQSRRGTNARFA
jgi:sulfate/thiosulfate transport system ATP-binding protein